MLNYKCILEDWEVFFSILCGCLYFADNFLEDGFIQFVVCSFKQEKHTANICEHCKMLEELINLQIL